MDKLDTEQVSTALEALPEEYRMVATLYFIEDFSYQQIAEVLECPVGTVRSRLHRGRRILQKALWDVAVERGIVREPGQPPRH
jgi:RNA polymerase sigma-70 factor (ECF subfamily)